MKKQASRFRNSCIKRKKVDNEWLTAFSTDKMYKAEMAKVLLDAAGIESMILNKKDSTLMIGEIDICVRRDNLLKAKYIIKDLDS